MIPLPDWAEKILDKPCPYCKTERNKEFICGMGVREIHNIGTKKIQKGNIALTIEYRCPVCKTVYQETFDPNEPEATIEDIFNEMIVAIENYLKKKIKETKIKISRSAISNKEIRELKRILHTAKDHNDFLNKIGVSNEDIKKIEEQYNAGNGNSSKNK